MVSFKPFDELIVFRPAPLSRAITEPMTKEEKRSVAMFPSICLANSMPVRPDDLLHIAQTTNWESVSKGGRRLDDRVKSGRAVSRAHTTIQYVRTNIYFHRRGGNQIELSLSNASSLLTLFIT